MKKHHLLLFFLFLFISCSTHKKYGACELKETDETLSFPIDSDTKNNFNIYSVYKDKDGKEYFTFQNIENNTIHFYDLKQQKPAFRITPSQERCWKDIRLLHSESRQYLRLQFLRKWAILD